MALQPARPLGGAVTFRGLQLLAEAVINIPQDETHYFIYKTEAHPPRPYVLAYFSSPGHPGGLSRGSWPQ